MCLQKLTWRQLIAGKYLARFELALNGGTMGWWQCWDWTDGMEKMKKNGEKKHWIGVDPNNNPFMGEWEGPFKGEKGGGGR
jgi:hypothetical protein